MEFIGKTVKLYRLKKSMSQSELATGICSVSYLSKLENNKIEPSQEIVEHLFKRLDIKRNPVISSVINSEAEELLRILTYELFINEKDLSKARDKLASVLNMLEANHVPRLTIFANITLLRVATISNNRKQAKELINELTQLVDQMNPYNKLLFKLYVSIFLITTEDYKLANVHCNEALILLKTEVVSSWLSGYLYYIKSLICSQLYQANQCIEFAEKALEIFKEEFLPSRCIDSYMLLAISYSRFKKYMKALHILHKCERLISQETDQRRLGKILHNRALFYEKMGNIKESIRSWNECIELKKKYHDPSVSFTTLILAKTHYRYGDYSDSEKVLNEMEIEDQDSLLREEVELLLYLLKVKKNQITMDEKKLSRSMKEYKNSSKPRVYSEYCYWVAKLFEERNLYKNASYYFCEAYNTIR
ncbi:helix-turn-helix transcriptional regulator [Bacillus sp. NTK074B]|uniref:helix-turn-helix domain-containing protein n=1 Tax=Bacillus sp. NTK074B TaxID=2802174 RepID=UPI001A8D4537|nr:helix-turn-helix transcriptional regulator [Bacillus sp. NTK074B]